MTGRPAAPAVRDGVSDPMRPRVLLLVPFFPPVVGGAGRQVAILAPALRRRGVECEVLTWGHDPATEADAGGVPVHRVPPCAVDPPAPGRPGDATGAPSRRMAEAVRAAVTRFDVVHAHDLSSPATVRSLRPAADAGLATIGKPANGGDWFDLALLRRTAEGRAPLRWLLESLGRWQAISGEMAAALRDAGIGGERIESIPNGVVVPPRTRELPVRARRFLHLGRIDSAAPRDLDGLVEAFESLAARRTDVELAIVGGGDRLLALRARAAASPAAGRIHLPGEGAPDRWLDWAHVLVQPSFAEGLSNALLEAMAVGLACVAYDVGSNREALAGGAAGVLVPRLDRRALSVRLDELSGEPWRARELGVRARARAEAIFDIDRVAERLAAVYRRQTGATATSR